MDALTTVVRMVSMTQRDWKHASRHALLGLGMAIAWANPAQAGDNDFDFSPITLEPGSHSRINRPTVTWQVSPDPMQHCNIQTTANRGRSQYSTGCVTWDASENTCHIFTAGKATHSQLGHLLVACMHKS